MSTPANELELARERLQAYLAAELRILNSQEYTVGNGQTARRNRRADLESVRAGIEQCRADIERLQGQAGRMRRVVYLYPR